MMNQNMSNVMMMTTHTRMLHCMNSIVQPPVTVIVPVGIHVHVYAKMNTYTAKCLCLFVLGCDWLSTIRLDNVCLHNVCTLHSLLNPANWSCLHSAVLFDPRPHLIEPSRIVPCTNEIVLHVYLHALCMRHA